MIKERYCSREVSKLLGEKGFDIPCNSWYYYYACRIQQPTHQMACDWLRKTYNIHIGINPISGKGYNATIYDVADFDDCGIIYSTESFFHIEEAYEAALKYSLENLV